MDKSNARISQLNFDAGLLYKYTKPNGKFFQVGLTFNPKQDLNGSANRDIYSYNLNASNLEVIGDSIYHFEGTKQLITLPTALGAGICTGSTNRWFLSLDASYSKWTEFRYLGSNPELKDQLRVSLGGQFRPSPVDIGKYYERINYRAGVKYQQSYLEINNTRLNEVGVSFGFGLPMKKSKSTINIAVEMGTAGTTDNNLIKENYFKITIGSALQERWFLKNRYN
jgi:long-subunit fatty acid transport protein